MEGLNGVIQEIGANPPMTVDGMQKILSLVPAIKAEGPFQGAYCSRLARAADAASVLALELDIDFQMLKELGQHGNKDGSNIIMYPGHDGEDMLTWQEDGLTAVETIYSKELSSSGFSNMVRTPEFRILVVSHRPIIAGLVGAAQGVTDLDGLNKIVNDPTLTKKGFVVFNYDGRTLSIVE